MVIKNSSYNIPKIFISEILSTGSNNVGSESDYYKIRELVSESGILYGEMNLSGMNLKGSMVCNVADSGIEMFTVTNYGNTVRIIIIYLTISDGDAIATITVKEFE